MRSFGTDPARGPDWGDVAIVAKEFEREYGCTVSIKLDVAGGLYVGGVRVTLSLSEPVLIEPGRYSQWIDVTHWPSSKAVSLEALIYQHLMAGLHELQLTHLRQQRLAGLEK